MGGLDEGLIGGDDLDLSILLRRSGYKLLVDRRCYVHHIGSQTGPRVQDGWNSIDHVDMTNNALIRKHGVKAWYECTNSRVSYYEKASVMSDFEGDIVRSWLPKGHAKLYGLDLGCGSNKTTPCAVGVDKTPPGEKGEAGGQRGVESKADVTGDVTALPFKDGSQDYVIARHILEHILDPGQALEEWGRVLRPGGTLIIACPNHGFYDTMVIDHTHLHAYIKESLEYLVRKSGLTVLDAITPAPGSSILIRAQKPARETWDIPAIPENTFKETDHARS